MWNFAAFLHLSLHQTGYIWVTKRQQVAALIGSVTVVTVDIWLPLMNHKRPSVCLQVDSTWRWCLSFWANWRCPTEGWVTCWHHRKQETDNDSFSGWWCCDNYVSIKLIDLQHPDSDVCGRCSRFNLLQIILLCERIHSVGALQGFTAVIKQVQVWFCSPHRVHLILKTTRLINNPFRYSEQWRNRSCLNIRMTHFSWLITLSK